MIMREKKNQTEDGSRDRKLRNVAEGKLARSLGAPVEMQEKTLEKVIHELRVHQIELEMQNEELRKSQLALEESRKRYADLYDFAPVGYFTFTQETLIKEANLSGATLLGVARQKLMNGRFRRFVAPSDFDLWDRHFLSVLQQDERQSCDLTLQRQDGSPFPAGLESIRIEISRGAFEIHTAITDMTERQQAEEALRESEEHYKTLFDEALDGICLADAETGIIVDCNQALTALAGRERTDLIGRPQSILHPPNDDQKTVSPTFQQHLTDKQGQILETQVVTRQGAIREIEIKANFLNIRGRKLLQGIFRDITERHQAEDTLRKSEEKYRSIFENAAEGIFQATPEGRFLVANPALARMYGYGSSEELIEAVADIGQQVYFNPEQRSEYIRTLEEKGEIKDYELHLKRKDGTTFWISNNARAVRDSTGKTLYYEGLSEDITSRRESEKRLKENMESLRKALGGIIQVISATVETRDPYTTGHQNRVADLARTIAQEMGLPENQVDGLRLAGTIHDLGKVSIPAEILSKPTRLTDLEYRLIQDHSQTGYDILKGIDFPWPIAEMVFQHHERMDGSGYPQGLKGDSILIEARILMVADVVEAIASHRPYRPSLGIDMALEEISLNRDRLYDPQAVDACLRLFKEKGYVFV